MALNLIAIKKLRLSEVRNPSYRLQIKFHLVMVARYEIIEISMCYTYLFGKDFVMGDFVKDCLPVTFNIIFILIKLNALLPMDRSEGYRLGKISLFSDSKF